MEAIDKSSTSKPLKKKRKTAKKVCLSDQEHHVRAMYSMTTDQFPQDMGKCFTPRYPAVLQYTNLLIRIVAQVYEV
jgi:hypothetical protein